MAFFKQVFKSGLTAEGLRPLPRTAIGRRVVSRHVTIIQGSPHYRGAAESGLDQAGAALIAQPIAVAAGGSCLTIGAPYKARDSRRGIPQGSPLSPLLA